ncbi:hypothetical protein SEA_YEET_169 [Mycobacterium phage Yeet]|uniref:Uncharacterized protein n=4 Tax=Omegavirus TaxID=1623292 RepID=A0A3S9UB28_9CAUD|nr:hypothetical protein [Acinetobacter baumannii]YP_008410329.1 hypothetical protein N860_gp171 [Mycobacterium phage Redno2]YP_008410564.1 hypothetical protein N857_gp175 [Mycobacterium phage Wanda]YP_009018172.1 hypothetical protein CL87_gp161 [Mycobacterium phage Thibault]YP_009124130.1 hypothetical protein VC71_gp177 [Mycobacterium phage Minerva]YP_009591032.1 hypothetical protein FDG54_gp176 [Mycobacterium phage Optimus]YP_009636354.1 hypothetical protein FGG20_gp183 [Mycobacterium phage 
MDELEPGLIAAYDQQVAACDECLDKFVATFRALALVFGSTATTIEFANDFVRRAELEASGEATDEDFGVNVEFLSNLLTVAIKRLAQV